MPSCLVSSRIGTLRLREATGEVLPKHEFSLRPLHHDELDRRAVKAHDRPRAARGNVRSRETATSEF